MVSLSFSQNLAQDTAVTQPDGSGRTKLGLGRLRISGSTDADAEALAVPEANTTSPLTDSDRTTLTRNGVIADAAAELDDIVYRIQDLLGQLEENPFGSTAQTNIENEITSQNSNYSATVTRSTSTIATTGLQEYALNSNLSLSFASPSDIETSYDTASDKLLSVIQGEGRITGSSLTVVNEAEAEVRQPGTVDVADRQSSLSVEEADVLSKALADSIIQRPEQALAAAGSLFVETVVALTDSTSSTSKEA